MIRFARYPIATSLTLGLILVASASFVASLYTIWLTTVLSGDAAAINMSGSLRMQSFRIAYALESQAPPQEVNRLLSEFEQRLNSEALRGHIPATEVDLSDQFRKIETTFHEMKLAATSRPQDYLNEVQVFVNDIDLLVSLLEQWSESKVHRLRQQQLLITVITLLAASFFALVIFSRVVLPLQSLMKAVVRIGQGSKTARSDYLKADEFGELSATLNRMAEEITEVHLSLESKIAEQTQELSRNNEILRFLFELGQALSTEAPDIETLKQKTIQDLQKLCPHQSFSWSLKENFSNDKQYVVKIPGDRSFLICTLGTELPEWQTQILDTVGDLFDNAINRMGAHMNESRIALLNERSVIARELHDSLAQQLSYLKIQVVRWIKLRERDADEETLNGIVQELREGLNSSYRKLRELLVTFRAHAEEPGLIPAVKSVADEINRISQTTKIHLYLDDTWPLNLSPSQEIHCQHVIREALTNVVKHANAENAVVSLKTLDNGKLEIKINDDGIGFGSAPEKPMHYGLNIMKERAERIGGSIHYQTLKTGGAGVTLTFDAEQVEDHE